MEELPVKNSYAEEKEPLTNVQRLMDVINNRKDNKIRQPFGFPDHPQEAAKFWIDFIEPRMKYEISTASVDPYQERLVNTLKEFYKLSIPHQRYLIQLRGKGIYWRGDTIEFMQKREKISPEMTQKARQSGLREIFNSMGGLE
jgi:hypothetical protein